MLSPGPEFRQRDRLCPLHRTQVSWGKSLGIPLSATRGVNPPPTALRPESIVIIANESLASFLPASPAASLSSRETLDEHLLGLATAATQGDEVALNELMERFQEPLRRIVRIKLGAHMRRYMDSMDVVQGTYISASREITGKSFKSTGAIVKWLSTIALHKICDAYDYHTARKRDFRRTIDAIQENADEPDLFALLVEGGMGPDEDAEGSEFREIVDEAISELPDDQRDVILLRDFSATPWREVGLALGGRTAHAAQELHRRALARLRNSLSPKLLFMGE